jgi:hypothetical protein
MDHSGCDEYGLERAGLREENKILRARTEAMTDELRDFHDWTIDQGWHECEGIPGGCPVENALGPVGES